MSLLEIKFCSQCEERTYHRYKNSLRCKFTAADCWQCVNCDEQKRRKPVWRDSDDVSFDGKAL